MIHIMKENQMDIEDIHKLTVYIIRKGNWKMKNRILSTVSALALSISAVAAVAPSASAAMTNADLAVVKEDRDVSDGIETSYQLYNDGTARVTVKSTVDVDLSKDKDFDLTEHISYDKSLYDMEMLDGLDCYGSYKPFADGSSKNFPLVFDEHKGSEMFDTRADILIRNTDSYPDKIYKGDVLLNLKFTLIGDLDKEGAYINVNSCDITVIPDLITIRPESTENAILWYEIERKDGLLYECSIHRSGVIDYVVYNANPLIEPDHEGNLYTLDEDFGFEVPTGYAVAYDFAPTVQGIGLEKADVKDGYSGYHIWSGAIKPKSAEDVKEPKGEKGAFFWAQLTPEKDRTEFADIEFAGLSPISGAMIEHIDCYTKMISGDANCDGKVNLSDAVLIMQSLSNPSKYKLTEQGNLNADCTSKITLKKSGDGVTTKDALAIQQYALGLIDSLPPLK